MPTIDISQLPPPDVIETLDFEQIFADRKAALLAALPEELREPAARVLQLESEPLTKLLEESAYRELLLRQQRQRLRVNFEDLLPFKLRDRNVFAG